MTLFTVTCPMCGEFHRQVGPLQLAVMLGRHPLLRMIPDTVYSEWVDGMYAEAAETVA